MSESRPAAVDHLSRALTSPVRTYEELCDAAEDLRTLLEAVAANAIDLTPLTQIWLTAQLEEVELALARELDGHDPALRTGVNTSEPVRQTQERGAA